MSATTATSTTATTTASSQSRQSRQSREGVAAWTLFELPEVSGPSGAWLGVEVRRGKYEYLRVNWRESGTGTGRARRQRHAHLGPVRQFPDGFGPVFVELFNAAVTAGATPNKVLAGRLRGAATALLSARTAALSNPDAATVLPLAEHRVATFARSLGAAAGRAA